MSEARPTRSRSASRARKDSDPGRDATEVRPREPGGSVVTSPIAPPSGRDRSRSFRLVPLIAAALGLIAAAAAIYDLASLGQDPAQLTAQAEADIQAGRWDAARAGVRKLGRLRAPTAADRLLLARIDAGAGDEDAALRDLRPVFDDSKLGAQALYMAGLIHRRRNRLREAEADYRAAIGRDPGLVGAHRELIYILGMQSRRRELDRAFKAMARVVPLSNYDVYIWCLTHFVNWGSDSADDLQPCVAADPEDRESRLAMARMLQDQAGQEARFEEVLKTLPPDDPEVQALRIEKSLSRGKYDEAVALISATRAETPHLDRLRARIALRRGDRDGAVRFFRRALSDEPYDRVSNAEFGKALLLQGHRDEAEKYLSRARQLDELYNVVTSLRKPRQDQPPPELHRLARICEAAGLTDEARGWYMVAISQDPLDRVAQQALHRLGSASTATRDALER